MTEKETPKEPEYESKKLSETHALTVQNMKLRAELNNAKMQDLQKDLESLKGALGAYVNSIKGEYFPGTDSVMLNVCLLYTSDAADE